MRSLRKATKSSPRSPQLEKAHAQQRRPNTAKNKLNLKEKDISLDSWESLNMDLLLDDMGELSVLLSGG